MSKFVSNTEIMDLFKEIEDIKAQEMPDNEKAILVNKKRNEIVMKMSFMVDSKCRKYKKFPNYEDLKQEGLIGLIKAVNRFDYTRFPNFFVYSDQWIFNHIAQSAKKFDVVYNPSKKKTVYYDIDIPEGENTNICPENMYYKKEVSEKIKEAISSLKEREKTIIKSTFGLNQKPETLRKIGKEIGLTHERVRQIQIEVVKQMANNKSMIEAKDISGDL